MRGNSDTTPKIFVNTLGGFQFRYNITESTSKDGRTSFNFDYVNTPDIARSTLIAALIASRYSASDETALVNNELATPDTTEYAEYQAYRAEVKQIVTEALNA